MAQEKSRGGEPNAAAGGGVSRARLVRTVAYAVVISGWAVAGALAGCSSTNGFKSGSSTQGHTVTNTFGSSTFTVSTSNQDPSQLPQIDCGDGGGLCACDGGTTTITGLVLDPAGINPVFNVNVFEADTTKPLPDLSSQHRVCGCKSLYPEDVLATAYTDATGHFTIGTPDAGAQSGNGITIVVQAGKWRKVYGPVDITPCAENVLPPLTLPRNSSEGSLPDIAISTGGADSLECLPLRIGVSESEYVGGSGGPGHIHIFQGFNGANTMPAGPESAGVPGDPDSGTAGVAGLWDSVTSLNAFDAVLLSCEGHETTGGNPGRPLTASDQQALMDYGNHGGRIFASHYHYKWLNSGPFSVAPGPLAAWQGSDSLPESVIADDSVSVPADMDVTLQDGVTPFYEGADLYTWLGNVGALTNKQLPIWFARDNVVMLDQPPTTQWIHLDPTLPSTAAAGSAGTTQYFSVDMPIGQHNEGLCGRLVYSDLHVSGGPAKTEPPNCAANDPKCVPADYPNDPNNPFPPANPPGGIVPSQCSKHPLTPQEEALEFMLFDLSSCLVQIGSITPPPPPTPTAR